MKRLLKLNERELKIYCHKVLELFGKKVVNQDGFLYAKGKIPVMLVAHLDTVHKKCVKEIYQKDGLIWSPQGIGGDDRAGVYMILEILKSLDCHVLFTEKEEIGGIGASLFATSKIVPNVNFAVEFDRKGANDAVFYDCDNQDFIKSIESHGFNISTGSFSDISIICPHLKIAGVNLSSGYYNAHSLSEYINIKDVAVLIKRAKRLIESLHSRKFEYIELKYPNFWNQNYADDDSALFPVNHDLVDEFGETYIPKNNETLYSDDFGFCYEILKGQFILRPEIFWNPL